MTLFLRGGDELPTRLYEQLLGHGVAVLVRPTTRPVPWQAVVVDDPTTPVGFEDEEALLPYGPRSFHGYRLLQEYFAFPARYLFVKLNGLRDGMSRCEASEVEVLFLSDVHEPSLDGVVNAQHFALHCTPAANLFPRRADRIHLTESAHEYHLLPDRTRPMDFEVHSVGEVMGYGSSAEVKQPFRPFFAWNDPNADGEAPAYYTIQRQPRALSARQRERGARSSYVGSEVFLSSGRPRPRALPAVTPTAGGRDDLHAIGTCPCTCRSVKDGPTLRSTRERPSSRFVVSRDRARRGRPPPTATSVGASSAICR